MSSFKLRQAQERDVAAIVSLVAALDVALLGSTDYTLADLREEWRETQAADRFVAEGPDGAMVGYGTIEVEPERGRADAYVHPEQFGRGVGAFLVAELEQLLAARGVTRVRNAVLIADERAQALLRDHGYEEIRRFWQMRIELPREPRSPVWPAGVTVTRFELSDAEEFHAVYESAFADHWQHDRKSFEEWRAAYIDVDDFSPELWAVARGGGEIVAGTIGRPERMGVAWIARLFTRSDWRRRGLGEALLYDAFGTFAAMGKRTVGLGVDAQSDTGAQRLYERAGMHVHWGAVVFEKTL